METLQVDFFAEDRLPELSLERNTERQIRWLFDVMRSPDSETVVE
jgi:hypothetical protein